MEGKKILWGNPSLFPHVPFTLQLGLPKSSFPRNNTKTYYNTFAVSAELVYGQPSQETPKNMHDQPIDGLFLCAFWKLIEKCCLRQLANSMQNQVQSYQPSDTRRPIG